jgi:tRNA-2-methylthio-N6-dimethylallyladenosine synthase
MIGKTYRVLVTGKDRKSGYLSGLTEGKLIVRFKGDDSITLGDFIDVKITSVTDFATEGDWIKAENLETVS